MKRFSWMYWVGVILWAAAAITDAVCMIGFGFRYDQRSNALWILDKVTGFVFFIALVFYILEFLRFRRIRRQKQK